VLFLQTEQIRGTLIPHSGKGRLIETGRCYGMETNVEKSRLKKFSRQSSSLKIMIDKKNLENVEYFNN
jgi:hypothetical protein